MKQELGNRTLATEEATRLFLEKSVNRYGTDPATRKWGDYERDGPGRGALAARLLRRFPEIALVSIHTAVAAHDLGAVRSFLENNPGLVYDRSPFDGWTPLSRLAYARLPLQELRANTLAIADLLLDAGADANAGWSDESNDFTPLVGVIGEGEGGQVPHELAEPFARLLIDRGAEPFVPQALYNTSLGPDSTFWLDMLWTESEKRGDTRKWTGPAPDSLGGDRTPNALAYLLGNAVPDHLSRVRWLLDHGADAAGRNFYSGEPVVKRAILAGREEMTALLIRHGAVRPELSDAEAFIAAIASVDFPSMHRLAAADPAHLKSWPAMVSAIDTGRTEVVEALLDLGMSPDISDENNFRALHYTTRRDAVEIARLLIARGAEIDPFERSHGGSPLTHANYWKRDGMIRLIAPHSHNLRGLCLTGSTERLRLLLDGEPGLANLRDRSGETALFCLPDDEDKAVEVAELLLSFGTDPNFRDPQNLTPAQAARRRGLEGAAVLIEEAEAVTPGRPAPAAL